jgi:hypothetical protein
VTFKRDSTGFFATDQHIDRLALTELELNDRDRQQLVVTVAKHLAGHLNDNSIDIFGPGDYIAPFIDILNRRGAEYAEFNFNDDGPSYPFMRHLGFEIQPLMGESPQNRWVIDLVMDKDGVDVYEKLSRASMDLLA